MDVAIRTWGLTKRYGGRPALHDLDLAVPARQVFGYLGPNAAGKTTTIRLLAGLLRPSAGRAEICGRDVVGDREGAQRTIGYLPGDFAGYPELTARAYLDYLANLRGGVDAAYRRGLADRLGLDLDLRLGAMSHGTRQKVGIVQAFMHRPAVLVLDEPTAGLDPLVQREFLGMVREVRQDGRTVFLSSHNLYEVETVADTVGILRQGTLAATESVEKLKTQAVRRMDLTFAGGPPPEALRKVPGVREAVFAGSIAHLVVEGQTAELFRVAAPYGIEQVVTHEPDLEEVFLGYYQHRE